MTRAAAFFLLTVSVAGGIAFWGLKEGASERVSPEQAGLNGPLEPEPGPERASQRAASGGVGRASKQGVDHNETGSGLVEVAASGPIEAWEVIPMNERGQAIPEAKITARRIVPEGAETLTGTGRTTWRGVPPGTWEVSVQAEGEPEWTSQVVLKPERSRHRTAARLGRSFLVSGTVLDTRGDPVARAQVFLLPQGARHPSEAALAKQGSRRGRGSHVLSEGIVASETSSQGFFQFSVPERGEYRLSVGAGGAPRWTQREGAQLRNGGPAVGQVTVPAQPRLTLSFTGAPEDRPTSVKVFAFDAELASRLDAEDRDRAQKQQAKELRRREQQRAAKQKILAEQEKAEQKARAAGEAPAGTGAKRQRKSQRQSQRNTQRNGRPQGKAARRPSSRPPSASPQARAAGEGFALFDRGWRPILTVPVNGDTAVLRDLPSEESLRFLFLRGAERHGTSAATRLSKGAQSFGTVTLPSAASSQVARSTASAAVSLSSAPKDAATEGPEALVGVVWGSEPR